MNLCNLGLHLFVGLAPSQRYLEMKRERIICLLWSQTRSSGDGPRAIERLCQSKGFVIAFEPSEMKIKGRKIHS